MRNGDYGENDVTMMVTTTVMGSQKKFVLNWLGCSLGYVLTPTISTTASSFIF